MNDETIKPVQTLECMDCGQVRRSMLLACPRCYSRNSVNAALGGPGGRGLDTVGVSMQSGRWATTDARHLTTEGNAGGDALERAQAEADAFRQVVAKIHAEIPREDRFSRLSMDRAVAEMADCIKGLRALVAEKDRMLHEARAGVEQPIYVNARYDKVDRSTVVIIHADESISHRQAADLARGLRDSILQRSGFTVPVVVADTGFHITFGRRPIGMPEYVREAYAEAAAASYGVTPDVVQRKKAERRARAVWNAPCPPGPEPRPPFGSKAIGTDLVPYPEPAL